MIASSRALAVASLVLAALSPPTSARADALPNAVLLTVDSCSESDLPPDAIIQSLRVELTTDGVADVRLADASDAARSDWIPGLAVIVVSFAPCIADAAVFRIVVADLVTHKRVERVVDLAEAAPGARTRALTLAIAELLRASWAELIVEPAPEAPSALVAAMRVRWHAPGESAGGQNAPSAPPVTAEESAATTLAATFLVRAFPGSNAAPLGGRASFDLSVRSGLLVGADIEAGTGRALNPAGVVDVTLATLGASARVAVTFGSVILSAGPRLGAGVAWVNGRASAGTDTSGTGPVILLGGTLQIDVPLTAVLLIRFGVEAAGTLLGFDALAGSMPVAGASGASIALCTGIGFAL